MFKAGDKVRIVNNSGVNLTLGKVYTVLEKSCTLSTTDNFGFVVKADNGHTQWFFNGRGEKVKEYPKEIHTYETSDGQRFEDLEEAEKVEEELNKPKKLDLSDIWVDVCTDKAHIRLGSSESDRVLAIYPDGTYRTVSGVVEPTGLIKDRIKER